MSNTKVKCKVSECVHFADELCTADTIKVTSQNGIPLRLHMLRGDRMFDLQKEIRGHIFPKTGDPLQGSPVFVFAATAAPGQKFRQFPRQNLIGFPYNAGFQKICKDGYAPWIIVSKMLAIRSASWRTIPSEISMRLLSMTVIPRCARISRSPLPAHIWRVPLQI